MSDTQWPRYEVFVQEQPGRPHQHAGSVHAPDPEMALLNARDVFVRRPECAGLWIAPAEAITGATAEELERITGGGAGAPSPTPEVSRRQVEALGAGTVEAPEVDYLVFAKLEQRGTLTHIGEVRAAGSVAALAAARQAAAAQRPLVLWVIPVERVERSLPADAASFFEPSRDKPYRHQAFYHIQTALQRLRRQSPISNRQSPESKL